MFILGLAGAAFGLLLLAGLHWDHLNSKDLGTMSPQWLAEYNAQHSWLALYFVKGLSDALCGQHFGWRQ